MRMNRIASNIMTFDLDYDDQYKALKKNQTGLKKIQLKKTLTRYKHTWHVQH